MTLRVLHLEAGRNLSGGPRQVAYLLEGLASEGVKNTLVCPPGSEITRSISAAISVREVPLAGDADLRFIARFRRVLRKEQPDIVHLHSRRGADYLGGVASRMEQCRVVLSRRVVSREPKWIVPWKYRLYERVVAISDSVRDTLIRSGVDPLKIVVVPSGVDSDQYRPEGDRDWLASEFGVDADAPLIGMVANYIPIKGHRFLVEALPAVLERFPNLKVLCFGRGDHEASVARQIVRAGLADHVIMAGFRTDLDRVLGGLDLLVHPATREGLGVSLLQASSCGVPIVASRIGGIPEVVEDGVTGILVPPENPEALTAAITQMLKNPDSARQMGRRGRKRIQAQLTVVQMVRGTMAVYSELLNTRGIRPMYAGRMP